MLDESVVPGPLLRYKNTSRLARGDDVRCCRALHVQKLIRMPPGPVPRRMWLIQRGLVIGWPFLSRARFWVARGVSGVEEVKKKGLPTTPAVPYSFQCYSRYFWSRVSGRETEDRMECSVTHLLLCPVV